MARVVSALTGTPGSEIQPQATPSLNAGAVVFVVDGPRVENGGNKWLLLTETAAGPGWFSEKDASGKSTLAPFNPVCPDTSESLTLDDLRSLGPLESISCFGSRDIPVTGDVHCVTGTSDGGIGGPLWVDTANFCYMGTNDELRIYGSAMTDIMGTATASYPPSGTFLVRGHFDDAASRGCGFYEFATSVVRYNGDPLPVMICRMQFVATSVTMLGN